MTKELLFRVEGLKLQRVQIDFGKKPNFYMVNDIVLILVFERLAIVDCTQSQSTYIACIYQENIWGFLGKIYLLQYF